MDKKSFIRGFGTGVLFAAVILGISFLIRTSDAYVAKRAKELGMVYAQEDSSLMLAKSSPDPSTSVENKGGEDVQPTAEPVATTEPIPKATAKPTAEPTPTVTPKPKKKKNNSKMDEEKKKAEENIRKEIKYLTIEAGDWSSDVSAKLERLGIISNAKDFDQYLNNNGYSSSISAGTYKVSVGESYSELARKITGR